MIGRSDPQQGALAMKKNQFIRTLVIAVVVFFCWVGTVVAETRTSGNVTGRTWTEGTSKWGETTSTQLWPWISSATRLWHLGSIDTSSTTSSRTNSRTSGRSFASGIIIGTVTTQHQTNSQGGGYLLYTSDTGAQSTANWWRCGKANCP